MQKIILGLVILVIILGLLYYFNSVKEGFGFSAQQLADLRKRRAEREKEGTLNKLTPLSQRQSTPFVRRSWRNRYKPCKPHTVWKGRAVFKNVHQGGSGRDAIKHSETLVKI